MNAGGPPGGDRLAFCVSITVCVCDMVMLVAGYSSHLISKDSAGM